MPTDKSQVGVVDLSLFSGAWLNTSDRPNWLLSFSLQQNPQGWWIAPIADDHDKLPSSRVTTYMDNLGYLAFKAEFELQDRRLILAANSQKELLVVTSFHRFGAGASEKNRVYREFFYRDCPRNK